MAGRFESKGDDMKTLIEELAAITPQRSLSEVASRCDIAFSRYPKSVPVKIEQEPFGAALNYSQKYKKTCLVIEHNWFTVVYPDARWMRSLRLYQSIQAELRARNEI